MDSISSHYCHMVAFGLLPWLDECALYILTRIIDRQSSDMIFPRNIFFCFISEYEISHSRTIIILRNKNVIHSSPTTLFIIFIYLLFIRKNPQDSITPWIRIDREERRKTSRHYTQSQTQTTNVCTVVPIPKWEQERERGKKNDMTTSYQSAHRTLSLIMRMMNCVCGRFDMVRCSGGEKKRNVSNSMKRVWCI